MIIVHHAAELDELAEPVFPAMKELRPQLADVAEFVERVRRQRAEGYRPAGSFTQDGAVAGRLGCADSRPGPPSATCAFTRHLPQRTGDSYSEYALPAHRVPPIVSAAVWHPEPVGS